MRLLAKLMPLLLVAAAPASSSRYQQQLMDQIERAVVLPKSAKPLNAYGRNYAFSGPHRVIAIYLLPSKPLDSSYGCEVMLKDLSSRSCTRSERAELAASSARAIAAETPAGRRRWFKSVGSLPMIADGGCTQVTVWYDVPTHHVLAVACNGLG